ncbi:MAG: Lrp/AsnC family transcriptional regulator [Granulosicoccus sp.]
MELDETDRALLMQLQTDASLSTERLAKAVGVSKTAAWNRVQRLHVAGIIKRQVVVLDASKVGLHETFFISIKTNQHNERWLLKFNHVVNRYPEIVEAHRLAGDNDYLLKVQVRSTRDFDQLYKKIVADVDLYSVTSNLSMQVLKENSPLPLDDSLSETSKIRM